MEPCCWAGPGPVRADLIADGVKVEGLERHWTARETGQASEYLQKR